MRLPQSPFLKTRPDAWDTYPEMTRSEEQASDHGLVYIDLDL